MHICVLSHLPSICFSSRTLVTNFNIHLQTEAEHFGIDWGGPVSSEDSSVSVPETNCPLTACDLQELQCAVTPLASSSEYGVDLYERTLDFVGRKLDLIL